jgi:hypothetical protein
MAAIGGNACGRAWLDAADVGLSIDLAAHPLERDDESGQIGERMKLPLPWKAKARAQVEVRIRTPLQQLDARHSSSASRIQFGVKDLVGLTGRDEEVSIQPLEPAVDPLLAHDGFDPVDGRRMTAGSQAGAIASM